MAKEWQDPSQGTPRPTVPLQATPPNAVRPASTETGERHMPTMKSAAAVDTARERMVSDGESKLGVTVKRPARLPSFYTYILAAA